MQISWIKRACVVGLALVAASALAAGPAGAIMINGAGASFPYPLHSQWGYKYESLTGMKLNYQSIGSGGGIAQIKAKTVDFGASDAPMKAGELDEFGLIQFPMVIGGVVPVVNLSGIGPGTLRLTHDVLADIFLGEITRWDNSRIKEINPGVELPGMAITVVHRADGSGTTWIFTNYLDKISPTWHQKVGTGKAVDWPAGVGGKGNEGVAVNVQRIDGSIGYVEYAYAVQNKLAYVLLRNRGGRFVAPNVESFQSAAANADWAHSPGYYVVLTDQPGENSWPITGASFILIYRDQPDAVRAQTMLEFFDWCYRHGAQDAIGLDYVPMPESVVELVEDTWRKEVRANGGPTWQ